MRNQIVYREAFSAFDLEQQRQQLSVGRLVPTAAEPTDVVTSHGLKDRAWRLPGRAGARGRWRGRKRRYFAPGGCLPVIAVGRLDVVGPVFYLRL
jgi:hypothetical protein